MAKYALCIGINDYPGTESDLSGCVNDAKDWGAELESRGFEVKTLLDGAAKKKAIVESMEKVIEGAKSGDVVVITFSGHGTWVPDIDGDENQGGDELDSRDEALCPSDISGNAVITDDLLFEIFTSRARGVRLVFLSDCCHSGTVARYAPSMSKDRSPRKARFLPPSTFLPPTRVAAARAVERKPAVGRARASALLLSGCQDWEYSYDATFDNRPNGAFTRVALDTLKEHEPATYSAWYRLIRKRLPSQDYPQQPNIVGTSAQRAWKVFE